MILADKIIYLRKKAGWSQEELAEKMGVSRQSISKWEGALSVPDMNRILRLSELFDVSTDYLLRDEIEEEEKNPATDEKVADETGEKLVPVSMELANDYLAHCQRASVPTAFGVFLCIMSPVFLLLLAGAGEAGLIPLTEDQGALLGTTILILLIVAAVSIFVINGHYDEKYEFLEKEALDTAYGVDGMVRDRKQKYERSHVKKLTVGRGAVRGLLHPHFPDDPSVRGRKCDGADRGNSTASVSGGHRCVPYCTYLYRLGRLPGSSGRGGLYPDRQEAEQADQRDLLGLRDSCVSAGQLPDYGVAHHMGDLAGGRDRVGCSQQHLPEPGRAVTFKILAGERPRSGSFFFYSILYQDRKYGKFVLSKAAGISPPSYAARESGSSKASFSEVRSTACNQRMISL